MRFQVDHIDERGERVQAGLADAWAVEAAEVALDGRPTALDLDVELKHAHGLVFVNGRAEATVPATCERCGEATELVVETDIELSYSPAGRDADAPTEAELHPDELDVGWFDNGEILVGDILREAFALAMPSRVVCADTDSCDARVQALLSTREESVGHPGFAALKNLIGS